VTFKDLGDWAEIAGLQLPIAGKTYTLPPISAELGPRLQALVSVGFDLNKGRIEDLSDKDKVVLDDMGERELFRDILGDVYDEMTADDVPWPALKHAAMTSMFDAVFDRDTAEKYWESLGKVRPPNRAARRSKTTASASATKKASAAGTTSRRATAKKAAGTAGRRSSSTGG
jgi:hypothetical protein